MGDTSLFFLKLDPLPQGLRTEAPDGGFGLPPGLVLAPLNLVGSENWVFGNVLLFPESSELK